MRHHSDLLARSVPSFYLCLQIHLRHYWIVTSRAGRTSAQAAVSLSPLRLADLPLGRRSLALSVWSSTVAFGHVCFLNQITALPCPSGTGSLKAPVRSSSRSSPSFSSSGPVDSNWKPEDLRGHPARAEPSGSPNPILCQLIPGSSLIDTLEHSTKTQQILIGLRPYQGPGLDPLGLKRVHKGPEVRPKSSLSIT